MSRAFTSEEYEVPDMPVYDEIKKEEDSADHDLVLRYAAGRKATDPSLPYEIGMHFLKGDGGFFQSDMFAEKWLSRSAEAGFVPAMLALAEFYLRDTKANGYGKAAALLRKAADGGSEAASLRLDMGSIPNPKTKDAYVTYRLNAALGNADACRMLGKGYEEEYYGKGRWKTAVKWYARGYRRGDAECKKLALALSKNKKIPLDGNLMPKEERR